MQVIQISGLIFSFVVCRVVTQDCGEEASRWLSSVLGKNVRLVYKPQDSNRGKKARGDIDSSNTPALALTNEAQYLLLSTSSVEYLHEAMKKRIDSEAVIDVESVISRFRCNFLIAGAEPFTEETWSNLSMHCKSENIGFQCTAMCNRCSMICVDSRTGEKDVEPLRTLGTLPLLNHQGQRRNSFGIYLKSDCIDSSVSVGDVIVSTVRKEMT